VPLVVVSGAALVCWMTHAHRPLVRTAAAANGPDLQLTDSIERHGITWTLAAKTQVGRFVNGDCYVVGPVTVMAVSPAPTPERNGSSLNLPLRAGYSPFDARSPGGRFDPKMRTELPLEMNPGDILISSISVEKMREFPAPLRPADRALSPVRTVSVLTCLAEPAPADAFRPSYCDYGEPKLYLARNVKRDLLPRLPKDAIPHKLENDLPFTIDDWADMFERPWLDVCFFSSRSRKRETRTTPQVGHARARRGIRS